MTAPHAIESASDGSSEIADVVLYCPRRRPLGIEGTAPNRRSAWRKPETERRNMADRQQAASEADQPRGADDWRGDR